MWNYWYSASSLPGRLLRSSVGWSRNRQWRSVQIEKFGRLYVKLLFSSVAFLRFFVFFVRWPLLLATVVIWSLIITYACCRPKLYHLLILSLNTIIACTASAQRLDLYFSPKLEETKQRAHGWRQNKAIKGKTRPHQRQNKFSLTHILSIIHWYLQWVRRTPPAPCSTRTLHKFVEKLKVWSSGGTTSNPLMIPSLCRSPSISRYSTKPVSQCVGLGALETKFHKLPNSKCRAFTIQDACETTQRELKGWKQNNGVLD
jgi:hypothetical protein